jgi:hypothetical protein
MADFQCCFECPASLFCVTNTRVDFIQCIGCGHVFRLRFRVHDRSWPVNNSVRTTLGSSVKKCALISRATRTWRRSIRFPRQARLCARCEAKGNAKIGF